eukprot:NODE_7291_length_463_cov_57.775362_g6462_i0.p2 GENE.NODE_7291_length_463_cov_57.775362_g6462_i0~~NODE_7291_length_463_cov_57.775362_g6462_i0.p2  ORF type:complete len:94 (+),score=12.01 NODE_7291_length_463_cov_57.775362_g6462_i0:24-284(+)
MEDSRFQKQLLSKAIRDIDAFENRNQALKSYAFYQSSQREIKYKNMLVLSLSITSSFLISRVPFSKIHPYLRLFSYFTIVSSAYKT